MLNKAGGKELPQADERNLPLSRDLRPKHKRILSCNSTVRSHKRNGKMGSGFEQMFIQRRYRLEQ